MFARLLERKEIMQEGSWTFKHILTFECDPINREIPSNCELTISEYSGERNLDQNGLYWKTVGEIARITGSSKTEIHNQLLNDYGEMEIKNGEPVIISMRDSFNYLTDEDLHLMPTGKSYTLDGITYVIYYKLKNSKNMTKKEFSRLLDGALYEKEQLL